MTQNLADLHTRCLKTGCWLVNSGDSRQTRSESHGSVPMWGPPWLRLQRPSWTALCIGWKERSHCESRLTALCLPQCPPQPWYSRAPPMPQTHVRESLGAVPKDQEGQMP